LSEYVTGRTSLPPFPAVISGRRKKAMFVVLVLLSAIVAVSCPPDAERDAVAVTFGFEASVFSPVRFA
jgi:hypothetical protein